MPLDWVLGGPGDSCSEVCFGFGQQYDEATKNVAGSAGSDENCEEIMDRLNAPGTGLEYGSFDCDVALGCVVDSGLRGRCSTPATTSIASDSDSSRICACKKACAGVNYDGACWYLGDFGQSCNEVCASHCLTYDSATASIAGSEGTDGACEELLDLLSAPGSGLTYPSFSCTYPVGCLVEGLDRARCASPKTTGVGAYEEDKRVCACR